MRDIAIDVGSGITKVRNDEGRESFKSLSGIPEVNGFDLESIPGQQVSFGAKNYAVGTLAGSLVPPAKLANTRDEKWYQQEAYKALMYAAMAKAMPGGYEGKVSLCTGLPQSGYSENKQYLMKLLATKHRFLVDGVKYVIHLRSDDLIVMPQVAGLFVSQLARQPDLSHQKVGVLDVGTYTCDFTVMDNCQTLHWASGGCAIGMANVIDQVRKYVESDLNISCSDDAVSSAIKAGSIYANGREVKIESIVRKAVFDVAEPMVKTIAKQWEGAGDSRIVIGGGGGNLFAPAVRLVFNNADTTGEEEPIYSVVEGYYAYLKQRRAEKAA